MNIRTRWSAIIGVMLLCMTATQAQARQSQMIGKQAPALEVDQWYNLVDKQSVSIEDLKGKVVYMYFFQSWCPGCHSHGFPTLVKLIDRYKNDDNVAFIAVQTVFEGYAINSSAAALRTAKRYELTIPVGHSGSDGNPSKVMKAYKTGGTPWTVIVDPKGIIKYADFHISEAKAVTLIEDLK